MPAEPAYEPNGLSDAELDLSGLVADRNVLDDRLAPTLIRSIHQKTIWQREKRPECPAPLSLNQEL
ncbi:hypothetical protein BN2475_630054 [Paraburkholderia ribeironis]|uniref:Uncharacterized protein n=1 Tax=Paraburkholderia ribeironis TaxID=1247936 RepID=A0A1N7SFN9_9BURK|nr:hypothetical protein BN2475_630054 [Paraburkholderia ribeironis]